MRKKEKKCNFICAYQKKAVPLHRISKQPIINLLKERKSMARKRNCESKSFKTAKGSSITFVGVVNKRKYQDLLKALQWDLYREEKGNDLVVYLPDDWWYDELENNLRANHWDYLMGILDDENIKIKKENVVLSKHLPEYLPKLKCTAEEWYEHFMESTEREENGSVKGCRRHFNEDAEEEPAVVKTYSINEYKTNGVF